MVTEAANGKKVVEEQYQVGMVPSITDKKQQISQGDKGGDCAKVKQQSTGGFEQKYKTAWRLGSGSYGSLYLCKHLTNEQLFAVKISNFNHHMFQKEAEMMQLVKDNPNIVSYEESFDQLSDIRIVMEYCPMDLIDLWNNKFKWERNGPLDIKWEGFAQIVFKQMVLGVHHCHKNGMVHCDIKPDNFLLGWDGLIKLTDFAFAQHVPKDSRLHVRIGTLYYMAPEVLQQDYSYKADIYSLGVSLLYMLIGKRLSNRRANENDSYSRSLTSTEINWNEAPMCHLPAECVELLQAMLSKDEHMRPTTNALLNSPWLSEIESDMPIPIPDLPYLTPPPYLSTENNNNNSQRSHTKQGSSQFRQSTETNSPNSSSTTNGTPTQSVDQRGGQRGGRKTSPRGSGTSSTPSPVSPIDPPSPVISMDLIEGKQWDTRGCFPKAGLACDELRHYCGLIATIRTLLGVVTEINRSKVTQEPQQQFVVS